jgi:hypothetical protein
MAHAVRTPAGAAHEPLQCRGATRAAPKTHTSARKPPSRVACQRSQARRPAASRQMETLHVHFADFRGSARKRAKQ